MFCFPEIFRCCFRNVKSQKCCVILDNSFWDIYSRSSESSQPCAVISDRAGEGNMQLKLRQGFREQLQVRIHLCQRWFRGMHYVIPALVISVFFKLFLTKLAATTLSPEVWMSPLLSSLWNGENICVLEFTLYHVAVVA